MTLVAAFMMPLVMLALVFFLARIEERHLTARPRAAETGNADPEGPVAAA